MKKRILSLICALAFCLTLLPSSALALNEKYLALGDSISTGYAPNGKVDNPFTNQVASELDYTLTNKAKNGETTETLKGKLNSLSSEISDADLITITIGGNDVMNALYEYLAENYTQEQITADDAKDKLMSGDTTFLFFASGVISDFAGSQQARDALFTFNTNLGEILSTIKSANSDVNILVTTQYNPYSYLAKKYGSSVPQANTISNAFNAGVKALNDVINTKKQDYNVVDVYKIFDDAVVKGVNPCNPSVDMSKFAINLDFHPNQTGHDLIARAIIDNLTNKVIPVTDVELEQKTLSLTVGNSANLTYIITPDTATYKTVTWESSNNEVAKVDENGTVKAVGVGTAIITVKTTDGGFTDTCTITVTNSSSGSSSSGGSSSGSSSSSGNKTETTTNPDGSTTTTITKPDGSKTETTKYQDGSQEVVKTDKDGTVTTINTDKNGNKTEVIENTDGSSVTTVTNKDGSGSKTTIDTTGKVKTQVTITENNTTLPMPAVYATSSTKNTAPVITVNMPSTSKVEIPVKNADTNTVVVLVKSDGTEQIIKNSVTTKNGVSVTLNDRDTIKIIDNGKDFTDVANNFWGADAVDFVTSREIFNGTSDTSFSPNTAMTRAMIVTVLARLNGVNTSTGDTWYEAGQKWAMENSISDGSNMNESLTREQLATMLYRYCKNPATSGDISNFTDSESVSSWAVYSMKWAVENGLISGMGDNTLNPQGEATRAQVATILMRFIENNI